MEHTHTPYYVHTFPIHKFHNTVMYHTHYQSVRSRKGYFRNLL